jgi:flagellar hook protein FlgE
MTTSFYNSITGLKSFQTGIDIWSHNISNINNYGYKENIPEFDTLFSQTLNTSPISSDIGMGSFTVSSAINLSQGSLISTDNKLDLAIEGEGWFQVSKNNQNYFTRTGSFSKDANGDIVLDDGSFLLGMMAGNLIQTDNGYKVDTTVNTDNLALTKPLGKINLPTDILLPAIATTQVSLSTNLDNDYLISKTAPATKDIDFSALYSQDKTFLNITPNTSLVCGFGDNSINYSKGLLSTEICINNDKLDGNNLKYDFYINQNHITLTLPDGATKSEIQNALSNELNKLNIQNTISSNGIVIYNPKKIVISSNNNLVKNSSTAILTYNSTDEYGFNTIDEFIKDIQSLANNVSSSIRITLNNGKIEINNLSNQDTQTTILKTETTPENLFNNLANLNAPLIANNKISSNKFLTNTQTFSGDLITANSDKDTLSFKFTKTKVTNEYSIWKAQISVLDESSNTISTSNCNLIFSPDGTLLKPKKITINSPQQTTINLNLTAYTKINPAYSINYGYTQNGMLKSNLQNYNIDTNGNINAIFQNGKNITIAQIPIYHFQNDQGLERVNGNLFKETLNSNKPILYQNNGEYLSNSKVLENKLESSNVNFAQAMTELIITQKAFSSSAKTITTSDQMIQRAIDMKKG